MIIYGRRYTPEQVGVLRKKLGSPRDYGTSVTERNYETMVHKLAGVYREAASDLRLKANSWKEAHIARVKKYRAMVERGKITEEDFKAWMKGQLFQEQAWKNKQAQLARAMADVDAQALRMINHGKTQVFAENANYLAYQMEQGAGTDLGFGIYDAHTVSRLIRDEPKLLPMPTIDMEKDFNWYNRMIGNAVTQGILQGEDLDDIVFRVAMDTSAKGLHAMRRNVRTAYTGAQNAGRLEGMRQAERLGIEVKKRWIAFLDDVTRDAHQKLDGQSVPVDEPFDSPLGPIMYPGDPSADPANVYNCRCTLIYDHPKYPSTLDRKDSEGNDFNGTYMEWLRWKAEKNGGEEE